MITVCATRRKNDIEITNTPAIISFIDPQYIKEKNILLIDEIVVTGKTINCVKKELEKLGAKTVKTCAIANRSNGEYICNYQSIITNKNNVIFPWDYLVLNDNDEIIVHPEYKDICKDLGEDLDGM